MHLQSVSTYVQGHTMTMELKREITIAHADIDAYGAVPAARLFVWMQRLADEHANQLGVGREALKKDNLVWMLARSAARFDRPIFAGERIAMRTFMGRNSRAACPRHFQFYGQSGASIGEATTLWMLIRPDTRRIVSPQRAGILSNHTVTEPSVVVWPEKLPRIDLADYSVQRVPLYADLDGNGHVNGARYVAWMTDAIPIHTLDRKYIRFLSINYLHEIRPGDCCKLMVNNKEDGYLFCGRSCTDDTVDYFHAKIILAKKEETV